MHVQLIVHGKAAGRPELREAVAAVREKGHRITVRPTWEAGDATRFAQRAVLDAADVVVAGGGDGTINEVAFGLVTASAGPSGAPSLGVVPLGTANDFARSAGIPLDLLAALDLTVSRPATPVDLGRIGDRVFLNVATGGFGTQVTRETPEKMKKTLGGAAYLVTGVVNIADLGNGGGEAVVLWELPEVAAPDTAAAPPDTTGVQPDSIRPDTTVVEPPDSVPPDTTVVEPPDSVPPDTTVVALRRRDPGVSTLSRLLRLRRRLPLPPRSR